MEGVRGDVLAALRQSKNTVVWAAGKAQTEPIGVETSRVGIGCLPVAYAGFSKGGGGQKI